MADYIHELASEALTEAYAEFNAQKNITEAAAKRVEELRSVDKVSPYTYIGSEAGRAEINYNIQKASLRSAADYHVDIQLWLSKYVKWFERFGTGRKTNSYKTFQEFYTDINKIYVNSMIKNYKFDCKCSENVEHGYFFGDTVCGIGNTVKLVNLESAYNTLGYIGYNYPHMIYPVEC
jgi:hypothetical protein